MEQVNPGQPKAMVAEVAAAPRATRRSGGCIRNFIKESTRIKLREFILNRSPHLRDMADEPVPPPSLPKQAEQPIGQQPQQPQQQQQAMNNFSDLEAAIKQLENERRLQYELVMRQFEQELMRQIHENRIKMSDLSRLYEFYLMRTSMSRALDTSTNSMDPPTSEPTPRVFPRPQ